MANPTTYFGWVMPNSADLVTDLPADFNVFGQGVDTSMQDLLGGTTGQVLSKTSNTNMDFTWVTPTDQTPLTTKGDLFTFTTVDARLGVGANDTVLTADSAEVSGLKWAAPAGGVTWATWTPTYTNLTVGNGTVISRVGTSGKMKFLYFQFTLGSTSSIGASGFLITLPATPVNSALVTGTGQAVDSSAGAVYPLSSSVGTTGGVNYLNANVFNAAGTYANITDNVTSTRPFTWATGDYLAMNVQYEVA